MKSIFIHSGTYVDGSKIIIDPGLFVKNFKGFTVKKKLLFENPQNEEALLQIYFSKIQSADSVQQMVQKK